MKKILITAILTHITYIVLGQEYISLSDGSVCNDKPSVLSEKRIEKTDKGMEVTYRFHYVAKHKDKLFPSASVLHLDGFGIPEGYGTPALPERVDRFAIPGGEPYRMVITDSSYIEIPMEIAPARPPMLKSQITGLSRNNVAQVKPYSGLYPYRILSSALSGYRSKNIIEVKITPIQYNYQAQKVRIYSHLSYSIEYKNNKREKKTINTEHDRDADPFLSSIIMNPSDKTSEEREGDRSVSSCEQTSPPGYLIITVPKYLEAVYNFMTWKRTLGFNVQLSCQSTWTETTVKNTVTTINASTPLEYLLIVGDFEDVPGKYVSNTFSTVNGNETFNFYTDYYYGCIDQNSIPQIRRGRLPVSTASEAMTVINKKSNMKGSRQQKQLFTIRA